MNQGATSGKKDDEVPEVEPCVLGNKETKGPTYRMLKPEVKQCLDKLIYQLDLCRNTVGLLEQRISSNENRLHEIVDYIKNEDISYVSTIESLNVLQRPMIVKEVLKTTVTTG